MHLCKLICIFNKKNQNRPSHEKETIRFIASQYNNKLYIGQCTNFLSLFTHIVYLWSAQSSNRGIVKMISSYFALRIKAHGYSIVKKMESVVDFMRKQVYSARPAPRCSCIPSNAVLRGCVPRGVA